MGGGRSAPSRAARSAPRNQTVNNTQASSGGGLPGGLGSTTPRMSMTYGPGSSVAQRAVKAVVGPRKVHLDPLAGTQGSNILWPFLEACAHDSKTYKECLENNGQDTSRCQFYHDMLTQCRSKGGVSLHFDMLQ